MASVCRVKAKDMYTRMTEIAHENFDMNFAIIFLCSLAQIRSFVAAASFLHSRVSLFAIRFLFVSRVIAWIKKKTCCLCQIVRIQNTKLVRNS